MCLIRSIFSHWLVGAGGRAEGSAEVRDVSSTEGRAEGRTEGGMFIMGLSRSSD